MRRAEELAVRTTAAGRVALVTGGIGAALLTFVPLPELQLLAAVGVFLIAAVGLGAVGFHW